MRIKSYSGAKGFGYIEREGSEDVIFDITACERFTPRVGDEIDAEIRPGRDGKPRAVSVRLRARNIPEREAMRETAARLEDALDTYRDFGLFQGLTWRELCEHFLRRREALPDSMTVEDVVALLIDRWSRGVETARLFVHSQDFHPPKAIEQLEELLADTPVKIEFLKQHGHTITLHAPTLAEQPQTFELYGLPDLVAVYNQALHHTQHEDRLFPLASRDDYVYIRLSLAQAREIRRRDLLPIHWVEVEPFL
ncbi:MAG TPA: hypothetical protein VKN99_14565 [Polyangia bacterium]|nr:hypothetical protein [Polyangia bacterium]